MEETGRHSTYDELTDCARCQALVDALREAKGNLDSVAEILALSRRQIADRLTDLDDR